MPFSDSYFAWREFCASNHLFHSGSVDKVHCGDTAVLRSEPVTDLLMEGE